MRFDKSERARGMTEQAKRCAVVTGGGSGIGEGVSRRFAHDGYKVAILDIDLGNAERVAAEIRSDGGIAQAYRADVSSRADVEAAIGAARSALGPVGILVNNAAIEAFTPFDEMEDAAWERIMAVNVRGPYLAVQTVLPDMQEAGWGRIINIASLAAQIGAMNMAAYSTSKGGIVAFTRTLAVELGSKGITVNAIAPSFIDTPMARRAITGDDFTQQFEAILSGYPIARMGRPEEIAAACAYFAAEDAGYTTGQLLGVNGGAAF